jgi:hypothetical protein
VAMDEPARVWRERSVVAKAESRHLGSAFLFGAPVAEQPLAEMVEQGNRIERHPATGSRCNACQVSLRRLALGLWLFVPHLHLVWQPTQVGFALVAAVYNRREWKMK